MTCFLNAVIPLIVLYMINPFLDWIFWIFQYWIIVTKNTMHILRSCYVNFNVIINMIKCPIQHIYVICFSKWSLGMQLFNNLSFSLHSFLDSYFLLFEDFHFFQVLAKVHLPSLLHSKIYHMVCFLEGCAMFNLRSKFITLMSSKKIKLFYALSKTRK